MASQFSLSPLIIIFFLLFFFSSANSLPIFNTPSVPCNSTPFPYFCRTIFPYNQPGTIQEFAKIAFHQSLSNAKNFLSLVRFYLNLPFTHFGSNIQALEDCEFLAELTVDFISQALSAISSPKIDNDRINDLITVMSATLTNQETCLGGLRSAASNVFNELLTPLANGTKFYSTSLALFSNGWVPKSNTEQNSPQTKWPFLKNVKVKEIVVVNQDGSGNFTTITNAVNSAPVNSNSSVGYHVIHVTAGFYNEYVSIPATKKYLMMIGDGMNQTVITGNRSVVDGWTTFSCATFAVDARGFVAVNITFQNTAGAVKQQAVAVRNGADISAFYNCRFEGYQDTLWTHSLRQFYRDCEIYGTIDYIFGDASVVLQNCKIYLRKPLSYQYNVITAQGRTDPNQNTGISIHNCSVLAAEDLRGINSYLGRPWKEYSRTVVMQSFIGGLIDPAGWSAWSGNSVPSTIYYAEYDNRGHGSNTSNRVTWPGFHVIDASEAANFTVSSFVESGVWLPNTGVPYVGGLI